MKRLIQMVSVAVAAVGLLAFQLAGTPPAEAAGKGGSRVTVSRPSTSKASTVRVSSYVRSNGTYVSPYYRTTTDSRKTNNYSYCGNYNPYTGSYGTRC